MNAIVLAAGVGTRLQPLTVDKPKTMVEVNGTPMLGRILRTLSEHRFEQIAICTGHRSEAIRTYCETSFAGLPLVFIDNDRYSSTNNMYSLYLAREYLTTDCLVMNADVSCDPEAIDGLLRCSGTAFAVDVGSYSEESMKVGVSGGIIASISKAIPPDVALGCSIDIYKFDRGGAERLKSEIERVVEDEGDVMAWTEVALDSLSQRSELHARPFNIGAARWFEIDSIDDLSDAEELFNERWDELRKRSVYFLDLDGTLALGGKPLPGAVELTSWLRDHGLPFFVLTNNSSRTLSQHAAALQACGLPVDETNVLLSTDAAGRYLTDAQLTNVFWVASEEVGGYLHEMHGLTFDDDAPTAVLLTYDVSLTYDKLVRAVHHLRNGAAYFATHTDVVCPTRDGPIPDIGTVIETVRLTTNRLPDRTFGKPSVGLVEGALASLGRTYADAVVVGDRLYTDIALKGDTEMLSVLVLSGETDRVMYEQQALRADMVVRDVGVLLGRLQEV